MEPNELCSSQREFGKGELAAGIHLASRMDENDSICNTMK